jgi:hypothetical protein
MMFVGDAVIVSEQTMIELAIHFNPIPFYLTRPAVTSRSWRFF